jgi:hypothetical protein
MTVKIGSPRRLATIVAIGSLILTGTGLAVAQPWSSPHHKAAPLGLGNDPDAPPLGRPIDADRFLNARTKYDHARIGNPYAGGHGNLRAKAIHQLHRSETRVSSRSHTSPAGIPVNTGWTAIGPNGLSNGQTTGNEVAVSGRATAIAIDPTDSNTVYIGTANGGVFRTTDGGASWTPLFDQAQSLAIGALALAPSDHTTLYVGTGEPNNSADSYAGVGLYRIDHAPTTATLVGPINPTVSFAGQTVPAFRGASISRIIVSPTAPGTIFVTSTFGSSGVGSTYNPDRYAEGLFRSTNANAASAGSVTMTALEWPRNGSFLEGGVDVASVSSDLSTLIVSVVDSSQGDDGVWRVTSALSGTPTWSHVLTMPGGNYSHLAVNGATAYAFGGGSTNGDLRVSTDSGQTWTSAAATMSKGVCGGQCWYDSPMAVDPHNAQHIILGGAADSSPAHILVESNDGGASGDSGSHTTNLHADNHAIAYAPTSPNGETVVWDANDGGVFKSLDGGATWTSENTSGLNTLQFQSMAVDPTDANFTIGGTQDNGTEAHTGSTASDWTRADFGDGGYSLIDSNSTAVSKTLYHTYFNVANDFTGLARWRTSDGSPMSEGNWTFFGCNNGVSSNNGIGCSDSTLFYAPMALGPGSPNTVYFGTDRLYRSSAQGASMSVVGSVGAIDGNPVSAIAIAPSDDTERLVGMTDGKVYRSTSGGSFTAISGSWPKTQGDGEPVFVAGLAIDPSDANRAYVVLGDFLDAANEHVWTTSNLLSPTPTWTAGTGVPDVPVNSVAIDPANPQNVYVGTDIGVYGSGDHGSTWQAIGTGLPVVPIFQLAIASPNTAGEVLRVATHGRGMWQIPLSKQLSSISVTPANSTIAKGETQQYTAVAHYSDASQADVTGSVTWSSTNPAVASIDTSGLATGVSQGGPVMIKASLSGVNGTTGLTVDPRKLTSITVTPASPQVANGATVQLHATGNYTDGTTADLTQTAVWTTGNPAIATVSGGLVTGKGVGGPVNITATSGVVSGFTPVTVVAATLSSLSVAPVNPRVVVGGHQQFTAVGHFTDGTTADETAAVQWSSSQPAVATIIANGTGAGLATAKTVGTTTVTATLDTLHGSTTLTVHHKAPVVTSFSPAKGPIGTVVTVKGKQFFATPSIVVKFGKKQATKVKVLSSKKLTCKVPKHAKTGVIKVTTDGGTATSQTKFKVT